MEKPLRIMQTLSKIENHFEGKCIHCGEHPFLSENDKKNIEEAIEFMNKIKLGDC